MADLITALLALLALIALRTRLPRAIAFAWLCVIVGMLDTVNTIIQSVRFSVFTYALGVNWVIVTIYVPALLVSSRSTGSRPKLSRASPVRLPLQTLTADHPAGR